MRKTIENAVTRIWEDDDPMSNCCDAPFTHPGWPDNDICSKCGEHADTGDVDDE